MFFIFPLAHESQSARRWPLVTLVLVALCTVFFLVTTFGSSVQERAAMVAVDNVTAFEARHAELDLSCDIRGQVRRAAAVQPPPPVFDEPVRAEHGAMCRAVGAAVRRLPPFVYGDVPAAAGITPTRPFPARVRCT